MPEVSIITPAYNSAKFLPETIDSVLNQTFSDWEMIVIDDASTDNTFSIASGYSIRDVRIKVVKNEKNLGVAQTRNKGIRVATGRYIAFLDSDDVWAPEKLEKQIKFMGEKDAALSYSMYQNLIAETKELGKVIKAPKRMNARQLIGNTAIGCLTVVVDRKKVGDFQMPALDHCEDICTWQSILSKGFLAYGIQEVLAFYRVSRSSLTVNKRKAAKQQWNVYRRYYKFPFLKSCFYFALYVFNAIRKHW